MKNFSRTLCNQAEFSSMPNNQKKRYANVSEAGTITPLDFKATDESNIASTAEIMTTKFYPEEIIEEDILIENN